MLYIDRWLIRTEKYIDVFELVNETVKACVLFTCCSWWKGRSCTEVWHRTWLAKWKHSWHILTSKTLLPPQTWCSDTHLACLMRSLLVRWASWCLCNSCPEWFLPAPRTQRTGKGLPLPRCKTRLLQNLLEIGKQEVGIAVTQPSSFLSPSLFLSLSLCLLCCLVVVRKRFI